MPSPLRQQRGGAAAARRRTGPGAAHPYAHKQRSLAAAPVLPPAEQPQPHLRRFAILGLIIIAFALSCSCAVAPAAAQTATGGSTGAATTGAAATTGVATTGAATTTGAAAATTAPPSTTTGASPATTGVAAPPPPPPPSSSSAPPPSAANCTYPNVTRCNETYVNPPLFGEGPRTNVMSWGADSGSGEVGRAVYVRRAAPLFLWAHNQSAAVPFASYVPLSGLNLSEAQGGAASQQPQPPGLPGSNSGGLYSGGVPPQVHPEPLNGAFGLDPATGWPAYPAVDRSAEAEMVGVAAGVGYSLTLARDGTLYAVGSSAFGANDTVRPTVVPDSFDNVDAVFGGWYHAFAWDATRTQLHPLGDNSAGQLCTSDDPLLAAATNNFTQLSFIGGGPLSTEISARGATLANMNFALGGGHSVIRLNDVIYACGDNSQGQAGFSPATASSSAPLAIQSPPGFDHGQVRAMCAGAMHTVALQADGSVWGWGQSRLGQLGRAFTDGPLAQGMRGVVTVPTQIPVDTTELLRNNESLVDVKCGGWHTLLLGDQGTIIAFGSDSSRALGRGDDGSIKVTTGGPLNLVPGHELFSSYPRRVRMGHILGETRTFVALPPTTGGGGGGGGATGTTAGGGGSTTTGTTGEPVPGFPVLTPPYNMTRLAEGEERVVKIDAGLDLSVAVTNRGRLLTFGAACAGGVALGRPGCANLALQVHEGLGNHFVSDVAVGGFHVLAVIDPDFNVTAAVEDNTRPEAGNYTAQVIPAPCDAGDDEEFCRNRANTGLAFTTGAGTFGSPMPPPVSSGEGSESGISSALLLLIIILAAACFCCLCLAVAAAAYFLVWRPRQRKGKGDSYDGDSDSDTDDQVLEMIASGGSASPVAGGGGGKKRRARIQAIDRADVNFGAPVGKGNFGQVYRAKWQGVDVACKAVGDGSGTGDREEILNEVALLRDLSHPNVVQFHGVVFAPLIPVARRPRHDTLGRPGASDDSSSMTDSEEEYDDEGIDGGAVVPVPWFVLEFMPDGSLLSLLRSRKATPMDALTRVRVASQAAAGLAYLHSQKVLHRDVAARNVLVNASGGGVPIAKLSDFGLSRRADGADGSDEDQYTATNSTMPVRWCAIESLKYRTFSPQSDIWMLAVTIWEIFAAGQVPYMEHDNAGAIRAVVDLDARPTRPTAGRRGVCDVPDDVWQLMETMWDEDPETRPRAKQVRRALDAVARRLTREAKATHDGDDDDDSGSQEHATDPAGYANAAAASASGDDDLDDGYQAAPADGADDLYQTTPDGEHPYNTAARHHDDVASPDNPPPYHSPGADDMDDDYQ